MYIGIDLGGTNVRVAGSRSLDKIEFVEIKRFELSHDFERDFAEINRMIEEIAEGKVDGIGVGTSGTYNDDRSLLTSGRNIKEWVNIPFVEKLSKKFNCSVFADNDAVVASLGETFYEQEKIDSFIYIAWGTGVGGAVVSNDNGKIISEKLDWHEYLEKIDSNCGGKGLASKFKKEASELSDEEWAEVVNDFEDYLLDLSTKIGLRDIVLGGGMTERQKERLQKVKNNLKEKGINLRISSFGHDGGLYGAMALIKIRSIE